MALADNQIRLNKRLRDRTSRAVIRIWKGLPAYDDANVDQWLSQVLPVVEAAQRQEVALTEAYLARALDRPALGVDPQRVTEARGTSPEEVYRRPFVSVWSALADRVAWSDAVALGQARASSTAATDVQMAMRDTLQAVGDIDPEIAGFQRVADPGACEFCLALDGAQFRTADPMPIHNFCVTGDTEVWSAVTPSSSSAKLSDLAGAQAATRRWYAGEVVVIHTASGDKLTVTPNHPILTDSGWVLAGELKVGQQVVGGTFPERVSGRVPDEKHMPTRIEDYFGSLRSGPLVTVPFAAEQFHGEVGQGEVDVVSIDGSLDARQLAALVKPAQQPSLAGRSGPGVCLSCSSRLSEHRIRLRNTAMRSVRGLNTSLALRSGLVRSRDAVLLGGGPLGDTGLNEVGIDRSAAESNGGRDLIDRLAGLIQPDNILQLERIGFSGHVFNLVTRSGWYAGNGILTHNCGCGVEPVVYTRGVANRNNLELFNASKVQVPDGVAVHTHGELGPVIGDPAHDFLTQ